MGLASMSSFDPYARSPPQPRSLPEMKLEYLRWLERKHSGGWKRALRDAFQHGSDGKVNGEAFRRAMGGVVTSAEELEHLFNAWAIDGAVARSTVESDLLAMQTSETGHIGFANRGASLDPKVVPGSKSKSNVESTESSLIRDPKQPAAVVAPPWQSAAARSITAATSRPPPSNRVAGVAQVTGGTTNNGSSVDGGIFSEKFLMAPPPPPNPHGGNKSNRSSQAGGERTRPLGLWPCDR